MNPHQHKKIFQKYFRALLLPNPHSYSTESTPHPPTPPCSKCTTSGSLSPAPPKCRIAWHATTRTRWDPKSAAPPWCRISRHRSPPSCPRRRAPRYQLKRRRWQPPPRQLPVGHHPPPGNGTVVIECYVVDVSLGNTRRASVHLLST